MTSLRALNAVPESEAAQMFARCCGARRWVEGMVRRRPFKSRQDVMTAADELWSKMERSDVTEAFQHHPRIGENLQELRRKFASTAAWSLGEQASIPTADEATLEELRDGNRAYHEKFGFVFIVCATGKTASEMLALLQARLGNSPERELEIAAAEQAKITRLRLQKLGLE